MRIGKRKDFIQRSDTVIHSKVGQKRFCIKHTKLGIKGNVIYAIGKARRVQHF